MFSLSVFKMSFLQIFFKISFYVGLSESAFLRVGMPIGVRVLTVGSPQTPWKRDPHWEVVFVVVVVVFIFVMEVLSRMLCSASQAGFVASVRLEISHLLYDTIILCDDECEQIINLRCILGGLRPFLDWESIWISPLSCLWGKWIMPMYSSKYFGLWFELSSGFPLWLRSTDTDTWHGYDTTPTRGHVIFLKSRTRHVKWTRGG